MQRTNATYKTVINLVILDRGCVAYGSKR